MSRHATVGFELTLLPHEPRVIVGEELYRKVPELDHAPKPLRGMREVVSSGSYSLAARRMLMELEASGMTMRQIEHKMLEVTPFRRVRFFGELVELPRDAALQAQTPKQVKICKRALLMAQRKEAEGFELRDRKQGWPRMLILEAAFSRTVRVISGRDELAPAHLLPDDLQELFKFGR